MKIEDLFLHGMKRELGELRDPPGAFIVDIGCGNNPHPDAARLLDYPDWDAENDRLPFADGTVDGIYAFHFLEHLRGEHVIRILRECERVLKVGGVLTIVVPHRLGSMAFHDLDHKTFWTEDTLSNLFGTPYYDKNREVPWRLYVNFLMIAGIVERNLAVFAQMTKTSIAAICLR